MITYPQFRERYFKAKQTALAAIQQDIDYYTTNESKLYEIYASQVLARLREGMPRQPGLEVDPSSVRRPHPVGGERPTDYGTCTPTATNP